MRNIVGQAVVGDDLYGRAYELGRLWELLEQGQHILMLAPRRVGKTSLMLELGRAPRENWDVLYVDVEGCEGPADCMAAIIAALAAIPRYRTAFEKIPYSNAIKNVLARSTPVSVNIDVLRVELKAAIGRAWEPAADQLQARLARLSDGDANLLIIIDELPLLVELSQSDEMAFQSVLRDLQADGYLDRQGDHLEFRSNLLREWWRKHHVPAVAP